MREVKEETGLIVSEFNFFTTLPNRYEYSGFIVPTLDTFLFARLATKQNYNRTTMQKKHCG